MYILYILCIIYILYDRNSMYSYVNREYRVNITIVIGMMLSEVVPPMLFNTAKPRDIMPQLYGYDS